MAHHRDALDEFDDVDDFLPPDVLPAPANPSSPEKHAQQINELLQRGNRAFRNRNYEEAIRDYSKAYKLQPHDPAVLLSNRSAAFSRLSQQLRMIPSSFSEERALYGLDPISHAELALKDAEKILNLHGTWLKGFYRKGTALALLERYDEAREAFLAGLHLNPTSIPLQMSLHKLNEDVEKDSAVEVNGSFKRRKREKVLRTDDFDCILCLKLLYNPVTTPCGHSFCRACLLQAMDHGNKCPMCRTVLFVSPRTYPTSVTLKNIIEKNFPEEYAERKQEMDNMTVGGNEILPLFVMDVMLPLQQMSLNIFEPRYRLMVRRVMEGNHRMGMVGLDPETGALADVACEVEITECEPLADGRFYIEVEGRRRFHIIKTWDQDGYRVGQISWLEDSPPEDTSAKEELQDLVSSTADLTRTWISSAQETSQADRRIRLAELLRQAEGMPDSCSPEQFSFWVANLLHMRPTEKLKLLRLTDTRERLNQELLFLRAGTSQGCYVQ